MKKFLFLLLPLALVFTSHAQPRLGIGATIGSAMDKTNGGVFGLDLRFQQQLGKGPVHWIVTPGYAHFVELQNGFFVLKSGLKTMIGSGMYLTGEIGIAEYTQGGESFVFTPSIGGVINPNWDLSLKYEQYSRYGSQMALRLAYAFSLKRKAGVK